jgi:hypothetical protein
MDMSDRLRRALEQAGGILDKPSDPLVESRENRIEDLERRGYNVRGKTDEEIIEIIKLPPPGKL